LFSHAQCYVLPTSSENFGNVVAEALAHGTPVITTCHTPWTDLPKHHCGWMRPLVRKWGKMEKSLPGAIIHSIWPVKTYWRFANGCWAEGRGRGVWWKVEG